MRPAAFFLCALSLLGGCSCSGGARTAGAIDSGDDLPPLPDPSPDPPWEPKACDGADVLCVDQRSSGVAGDGTAEHPISSVKEAIAAAEDGAVIQVAAGEYEEDLVIEDKAIALYGGFAGGGDFSARDPAANVSTLRGRGGAPVVTIRAHGTLVDGFRITGGTGLCDGGRCLGGGVYVEADDVTISRNEITGNRVESDDYNGARGGGVHAEGAVLIYKNQIHGNRAERGAAIAGEGPIVVSDNVIADNLGYGDHAGGLMLSGEGLRLVRNVVSGNETGGEAEYGWGGGVFIHHEGTTFTMRGNVVTDNLAPSGGSGVFIDNGADGVIAGDLIHRNRCGEQGGTGLAVDSLDDSGDTGSTVRVRNVTIADNHCPAATVGGNGVWVEGAGSRVELEDSIVWNNGPSFYVDQGKAILSVGHTLADEPVPGHGNFTAEPRFADPEAGNYHLRSVAGRFDPAEGTWIRDSVDSPAIDRGAPTADFSNEPEPSGGRVNLGAYGNTVQASKSRVEAR